MYYFSVFLTTILAEAPTTDLWIGLHNINGNPFYWTDGRPMRYSNWGLTVSGHFIMLSKQIMCCTTFLLKQVLFFMKM